jgi:D-3-phosphoglycerate dehydrogenase
MPAQSFGKFKAVFLTDGETDWYGDNYAIEKARWSELGIETVACGCETEDEVLVAVCDADAIISISVRVPITGRVIHSLDRCRCIVRAGVGYDNIDLAAATKQNIVVNNVPDYCTADVADHTVAMILALVRRLPFLDRFVRGGGWQYSVQFTGPVPRLETLTLGLVGFGRIAREVTAKISPLVASVLAHDPYVDSKEAARRGVQMVSLETLLTDSDILSLHLPLLPATHHLIGAEQLALMKSLALLVNTSRGGLVDQEALASTLAEGRLAAAALDVLEVEPLRDDNPLAPLDNVLFTPHFAGYSESAKTDLRKGVAESVAAVFSGFWPSHVLNPEVALRLTLKDHPQE